MTGLELDTAIRCIFANVTRHTVLHYTEELVTLGFTPQVAFSILERILVAKESR